jgi:hypothetical protein
MIINETELDLNEIQFILDTVEEELADREVADYDDEVKMSNDAIRKLLTKLRGL